jgi:hypothetical protein
VGTLRARGIVPNLHPAGASRTKSMPRFCGYTAHGAVTEAMPQPARTCSRRSIADRVFNSPPQ